MPTLDSVTFDTTTFDFQEDNADLRVWRTSDGDNLGVFYFAKVPDIEADINSVEEVRSFYRRVVGDANLGVIEIDTLDIDGCRAIRTIFKSPQTPHGMSYFGTITLPFQDFSFVLKVECYEHGMTGIRDSIIFEKSRSSGEVQLEERDEGLPPEIIGWSKYPYDETVKMPLMWNLSEDDSYDEEFPDHPLSRARRTLSHLVSTLKVDEELKNVPVFVSGAGRPSYPSTSAPKLGGEANKLPIPVSGEGKPSKPWWKFW